MIIKFNDPGEFLDELKKEYPTSFSETKNMAPVIHNPILRLTKLHRASSVSPNIHLIVALATIKSRDGQDIIRLERYMGDDWGLGKQSPPNTLEATEKLLKELEQGARELGLEVRAGMLESGNAD